jgi:D-alanyl-lipoteichoic acid acyltransferase DltB (MBOAT superfamily)
VWISYLWIGSPHYYIPFGTLLGCAIAFLALITAYRFYVRNENKKLDKAQNGDEAAIAELTRTGITLEMIALGWRYEMW